MATSKEVLFEVTQFRDECHEVEGHFFNPRTGEMIV